MDNPPIALRQPPPPPTSQHSGGSLKSGVMGTDLNTVSTLRTIQEGNSEMAGDNCLFVKGQTNIDSLPDDILFDVLLCIPAQDIYNSTRLVCRKWYHIILTHNFINAHLQHSTCGLLIQNRHNRTSHPTFVAMRQGRIEISKLSDKFNHIFLSSCNGLILEVDYLNRNALYITNPTTKQRSAQPMFFADTASYSSVIAYAATSMEYKVVHTRYFTNGNSRSPGCAILTVGVDKSWRRVNIEHLSLAAKELLGNIPLTSEGFVHWAQKGILRVLKGEPQYVLTLNVETEIITEIHVPLCRGEIYHYHYFSMGSNLSLLTTCSYFSWEVWEMKSETGEWTKMPDIDFEAQKRTFERVCCKYDSPLTCKLVPVGWLKFQEVLVFSVYKGAFSDTSTWFCIAYNVRTREIYSIELDSDLNRFLVHRNSLVWLDGC